jgi:hypothetical protein
MSSWDATVAFFSLRTDRYLGLKQVKAVVEGLPGIKFKRTSFDFAGVSGAIVSRDDNDVKVNATTASYEDVEAAIKSVAGVTFNSGRIVEELAVELPRP